MSTMSVIDPLDEFLQNDGKVEGFTVSSRETETAPLTTTFNVH
jgi:hypothetical protein